MQPFEQANRGDLETAPRNMDRVLAWLRTPRGLIISGILIVVAGLALGWNWLTALGLAPLILSVAPCAIMCALGLCMMGGGNKTPPDTPQGPPSSSR